MPHFATFGLVLHGLCSCNIVLDGSMMNNALFKQADGTLCLKINLVKW